MKSHKDLTKLVQDSIIKNKTWFKLKDNGIYKIAEIPLNKIPFSLSKAILKNPFPISRIIEDNLTNITKNKFVSVRYSNLPKNQQLNISSIRSKHIGNLIEVKGVIKSVGDVHPEITLIKYICPSCQKIHEIEQDDIILDPSFCSCGFTGNFKVFKKGFIDSQYITISESSDFSKVTDLEVLLLMELTSESNQRILKPGNFIKVIGTVKAVSLSEKNGEKSSSCFFLLKANNIFLLKENLIEFLIDSAN